MNLSQFKILTFDVYGTLIDWESGMINGLKPLTDRVDWALGRDEILNAHALYESTAQRFSPSKKYSDLLFILVMGFGMSLLMTLIITFINTGMDNEYIDRFFKAWSVSLPIAIIAALVLGPPIKKFVDKITK